MKDVISMKQTFNLHIKEKFNDCPCLHKNTKIYNACSELPYHKPTNNIVSELFICTEVFYCLRDESREREREKR